MQHFIMLVMSLLFWKLGLLVMRTWGVGYRPWRPASLYLPTSYRQTLIFYCNGRCVHQKIMIYLTPTHFLFWFLVPLKLFSMSTKVQLVAGDGRCNETFWHISAAIDTRVECVRQLCADYLSCLAVADQFTAPVLHHHWHFGSSLIFFYLNFTFYF